MVLSVSKSFDLNSVKGKVLVVSGCSRSLVDNFAVDWIIQSLGLSSIAVIASEYVHPLVQAQAFPESTTFGVTSSIELYSSDSKNLAVLQIRSDVVSKAAFADEVVEFARTAGVGKIVVVGSADACFMTGHSLESDERVRSLGSGQTGFPQIPIEEVHACGILKRLFEKNSTALPVESILMLVSGLGFEESCIRSERLARIVLEFLGFDFGDKTLAVPLSVQQLLAMPPASAEAMRIL